MRLLSSLLVLGLAALSTPCHALSASSTLARLSQRLAAAESALARIQSSHTTTTTVDVSDGPTVGYTFNQLMWTDLNNQNKAIVQPSTAGNIYLTQDNIRGNTVLYRKASNSQLASYLQIPTGALNTQFTVGIWVAWLDYMASGATEATIAATENDAFKLSISAAGVVTAKVGSGSVSDSSNAITTTKWYSYIVTYDGTTLTLYRNGVSVGSAPASGFSGSTSFRLLNNAAGTGGFLGSLDDLRIYNTALADQDASFLYSDTNTIPASGQSSIQGTFIGHFANTQIQFANRLAFQPTGDVRITGSLADVDLRPDDSLWIRMWGVSAPDVAATVIPGVGTATWQHDTMCMIFSPAVTVPAGATYDFTIPASVFNLVNPTVSNAATSSDQRWLIAVSLMKDQTGGYRQAFHWQGIQYTPATIDPNPSL